MAKQSAQTKKNSVSWTATQSYVLAAITLVVGIGIGWFLHSSYADSPSATAKAATTASSSGSFQVPSFGTPQRPTVDDVNRAAAPLLAQLQQRPNDADLLAQIGNLYYDSQLYPQAIEYYRKSLEIRPTNPDVRTDMGTAMWYGGDADSALKEFAQSLSYNPSHNGTLFNRGVVLMQGKGDAKGAIASWQKLLQVNPNYPDRAKVEELIEQAKQKS